MDPATIALVIAGAATALGIKRSGRRTREGRVGPPITGERPGMGSTLPDFAFGGRSLRPAVTERDRDGDEAADVKETGLSLRAKMANAMGSSARADVAGSASRGASSGGERATGTSDVYGGSSRPMPGRDLGGYTTRLGSQPKRLGSGDFTTTRTAYRTG